MKVLINYADEKYRPTQKTNTWTGYHIAKFDKVFSFGPEDVDEDFRKANSEIFAEKRGNGLWLWKPYFIQRVMNQCQDGDIVFYCDSGAFFVRNLKPIEDILQVSPIFVCDCPLIESCFTKPSCFSKMHCEGEEYTNTNQMIATYLVLRCCNQSRMFVNEWIQLCQDKELMWPEKNGKRSNANPLDFVAHREDQSILSLLCKKYGIAPHRDLSQRGKEVWTYYDKSYAFKVPQHDDRYRTILFLHKGKEVRLSSVLKYYYISRRNKKNYLKEYFN